MGAPALLFWTFCGVVSEVGEREDREKREDDLTTPPHITRSEVFGHGKNVSIWMSVRRPVKIARRVVRKATT